MEILKVKYIAEIETPIEHTGYFVNDMAFVPFDERNKDYQTVQEWIAAGGVVDPAYTQQELDDYNTATEVTIQTSMIDEGETLKSEDANRVDVGAAPVISDPVEYDAWLKDLYDDKDNDATDPTLFKPPATERQLLSIHDEDQDRYTFARYRDQWGYRWYLELFRADVNALAIAIYDAAGNYLYTTGGLIDTGNGSWYTDCPAGQADATAEDVYFKWLLGSASISSLEVYEGAAETKEGVVRSDERYD